MLLFNFGRYLANGSFAGIPFQFFTSLVVSSVARQPLPGLIHRA